MNLQTRHRLSARFAQRRGERSYQHAFTGAGQPSEKNALSLALTTQRRQLHQSRLGILMLNPLGRDAPASSSASSSMLGTAAPCVGMTTVELTCDQAADSDTEVLQLMRGTFQVAALGYYTSERGTNFSLGATSNVGHLPRASAKRDTEARRIPFHLWALTCLGQSSEVGCLTRRLHAFATVPGPLTDRTQAHQAAFSPSLLELGAVPVKFSEPTIARRY